VIATLLRLGIIGKDDWDVGLQQALEVTCDLLDVDRASYWSFRDDPSVIVCDLGYARSKKLLERGMVIHEANCPGYFAKIRTVQVLAVEDARAEPEIRALGAYLNTHEIRALLDVPVFSQGRLAGILCHENAAGARRWSGRDCELALTMSHTLSRLLEIRARNVAEASERRSAFLAQASAALAQTLDLAHANQLAVRRALPVLGDMARLIGFDGQHTWRLAAAHAEGERQGLLDQFCASVDVGPDSPGIGMQALR